MDQEAVKRGVQRVVSGLFNDHGEVRPSDLVEAARPKSSPAHAGFEWDNKKAGHEYRLIQARTWIRRVEVFVEDRAERMVHVPHVRVDGEKVNCEGYYKPASVMLKDEYEAALEETVSRFRASKAALAHLEQVAKHKPEKARAIKRANAGMKTVEKALAAA